MPVLRYERDAPGELLHIDTQKLGRIVRPSHRVTGNRRDSVDGAGWEFAHVAIDDHSRASFVQMYADERKDSAVAFLKAAAAHYAALGVKIKRLLTDNGSAYRSQLFARTCQALGIRHTFTRPYRPQTNGKAERFISNLLARMGLRQGLKSPPVVKTFSTLKKWRSFDTADGKHKSGLLEIAQQCGAR